MPYRCFGWAGRIGSLWQIGLIGVSLLETNAKKREESSKQLMAAEAKMRRRAK